MNTRQILIIELKNSELSLRKIAKETGIDKAQLSRFINKESNIGLNVVDNLLNFFGYDLVKNHKSLENKKKKEGVK